MIRSIWVWTAAAILFLAYVPIMAAVRLFDRDPFRRKCGRCLRSLGRAFTRIYPGRIVVSGLEGLDLRGPYMMIANHQSLADGPLTAHVPVDVKALFRINLFQIPVVGWLLRMAGEVPIDRSEPRKAAKAMLECARLLRGGVSVLIFPEGTRSSDGELLPFHDAPFRLAIREKVPVLPVVLEGASAALPKNSWMFLSGGDVRVSVLEPVAAAEWATQGSDALRDHVRDLIGAELQRIRARGGPAQEKM